jgi:uncharacterized membrane protein YraQ (UPF0718 family)
MHLIFRKEEEAKAQAQMDMPEPEVKRPLWQNVVYFASMVGILVFANWGKSDDPQGLWNLIHAWKWPITSLSAVALGVALVLWFEVKLWKVAATAITVITLALLFPAMPMLAFAAGTIGISAFTSTDKGESGEWFSSSWFFAKQILPLLLFGVLIAGFLLGRVGEEGMIPSSWVAAAVGGNSLAANFFASFFGAFMYFATLTEVPIVQGLIGSGMGKGPALALLLAGPALSLPSMLTIWSIMGGRKTIVFIALVIVMATFCGMLFGTFWG